MRIVTTLFSILTLIIISLEFTSESDPLPPGASTPGVPYGHLSPALAGVQHPPASSLLPVRSQSPLRSFPPFEPSQRMRSSSPPRRYIEPFFRLPSADGNEYGLDQLPFIRLIPAENPQRRFELRRYFFPADKRIKLLERHNVFPPVPTEEQVVISTHDGDVFGILTSDHSVAGIYRHNPHLKCKGRAKINMESGQITPLTSDEAKECPVGHNRRFAHDFRIVHMNHSERQQALLTPSRIRQSLRARSRSPLARCSTQPTRLPSADGKGYGLDQLPFILLTPVTNPNRKLELRKYTFPADKKLLLLAGTNNYVPMPRREHIVLSTCDGDVFAILESTEYLAGIYGYMKRIGDKLRVKINMQSGAVTSLITDEIKGIPVGRLRPILYYFRIQHVTQNCLRDSIR